ncbi:MAG TPA: hypothetical protein PKJ84_13790 [Anaerolineales bacterium]|nr:hypothetical protein [Candidatus Melainabacteria bacterium]HND50135.1 hypothetical protein [Anaerolineales bacterium]HNE05671.1 hypothetical protein [Anaerolineales bacterium]HNF94976.1 hypothetical protein [Anaerolineales bacterium]HNO95240.1 hypothetical protein [Anaerolineales bacterium]
MSVLADAIKALDPAPDKKKELTLALNLLSELSENKVKEFANEVQGSYRTAGTDENRTAPITTVVATHSEYRAYIKDDAGKIPGEVSTAIKKFVSGGSEQIITGIADLVTTAITAILGSGQATQQEVRSYYITVQARAMVRYDILAWRRLVEADGITSKIEACMAIYASKASIDVAALDLNTFLLAYEDQLTKMNFTEQQTIEYIDYAEEVYKRLRGDAISQSVTTPKSIVTSVSPISSRPGELVFFPDLTK